MQRIDFVTPFVVIYLSKHHHHHHIQVYGDVAGQMFIVQAITTPIQFQLFQNLASQGATVIKYPHSGRPAKKLFRFSFVEGKIYLTWKGKFGNQGVDLGEVHTIQQGLIFFVFFFMYFYVNFFYFRFFV
jgi:hypothetical protein